MSEVVQRWTIAGQMLSFQKIPFEIDPHETDEISATISVPIGHPLAPLLTEGALAVVDVVGPAGELRWWEGRIDMVEIGPETVRARMVVVGEPFDAPGVQGNQRL